MGRDDGILHAGLYCVLSLLLLLLSFTPLFRVFPCRLVTTRTLPPSHDQELDCRSWPAGPGRCFAQRRPVSPASISAGAGRDASRWSRKGGAEPPGHSAVCCSGRHARHRRRGLRRRDSRPRCWVDPGRLCGGEPERGVQAVHDRGARCSPRARCTHVETEASVLATRLMGADGWSLGQPGACLTLEATSGEPAGRSLSQLVSRPGAATVAYGAQSLLYNVLRMQGASASAGVPRLPS